MRNGTPETPQELPSAAGKTLEQMVRLTMLAGKIGLLPVHMLLALKDQFIAQGGDPKILTDRFEGTGDNL